MIFTDPNTETMCKLLGGIHFNGITLSRDQVNALMKLYGYHHEQKENWMFDETTLECAKDRPFTYVSVPTGKKLDASPMAESAMLISLRRQAERDGLRVMAMLAKFCEREQDPVKLLVQLCDKSGYDVGTLCEWAYEDDKE